MRLLLIFLAILGPLGGCDATYGRKNDASVDGGDTVIATCNGQQTVCPDLPYGLCVEVQQGLGHCVDWRFVGASLCMNGPADCPPSLPTGSFAGAPGNAFALCIKATEAELPTSTSSAGSGYCAAEQSAIDLTGQSTCTPNPCGASGFCSYVVNQSGAAVVSCTWPI
jgi:hypothetical protein